MLVSRMADGSCVRAIFGETLFAFLWAFGVRAYFATCGLAEQDLSVFAVSLLANLHRFLVVISEVQQSHNSRHYYRSQERYSD